MHVTFFMTGGWVDTYPDDVKALYKAGHELGNHSQNHKQMSTISAAECEDEIMKVHNKVKKLTGYDMKVFRPPYGDYNDVLIESAEKYFWIIILNFFICNDYYTRHYRKFFFISKGFFQVNVF